MAAGFTPSVQIFCPDFLPNNTARVNQFETTPCRYLKQTCLAKRAHADISVLIYFAAGCSPDARRSTS